MAFLETYGTATITLLSVGWAATIVLYSFTGIAQRVIKRLKQRWLYKKGGYVNTIMLHNNGVANEHFIKKGSENTFKYGNSRYVVVRKHSVILDGIPTQFNIEGIAEPLDLMSVSTDDKMATAELEQVIMNNETNDFVQLLKDLKPYALIVTIAVVLLIGASLYFGWNIYDVIVQQGIPIGVETELTGGR